VNCGVGKGSIFSFDIPVVVEKETEIQMTQPERKAHAIAPDQKDYRILIVEDRLENRLLLLKELTSLGFGVREAVNGQQGVEMWENWKPHLIWMDVRMPVMDGYEATRQIRAKETKLANGKSRESQRSHPQTVIIALTANAFEEDRQQALSVGCDDFVRKPFQEEEILQKMSQYLGVRYVYEGSSQISELSDRPEDKADSYSLNADSLAAMPAEWVAKLHAAAFSAREKEIWRLIEQIPEEHAQLADALAQKVKDFRLDLIVNLTSNG
jgi:CheY-like chemotaxis protein